MSPCDQCQREASSRWQAILIDGGTRREQWICADCFLRRNRYILDIPGLWQAKSHAASAVQAVNIVLEGGLGIGDPRRVALLSAAAGFLEESLREVRKAVHDAKEGAQ